jgi:predicted DCC family thiol-disulfide oxidoreductase YuxK
LILQIPHVLGDVNSKGAATRASRLSGMASGILVYDADCGFCTTSVVWLAKRRTFEPLAWQFIDDLARYDLDYEKVSTAAHWIEDDRRVASGSDAIGSALISRGGIWAWAGRFIRSRLVRPVARVAYRLVATNRHRMPGGTAACKMPKQ